jgi:prepilin-type N-terminal cleavage/methylation domain-containing protein
MTDRRGGFTLLELLAAVIVASVLIAAAVRTELVLHRSIRGSAERAGAAATLRVVERSLDGELGALGSDSVAGGDLAAATATEIVYRAPRGLWLVCRVAVDTLVLSTSRLGRWQSRDVVPSRDSVLLYLPGDSVAVIDAWLALPVVSGPFAGSCPSGEPASVFTTSLDAATIAARRIPAESVARSFEVAALSIYGSGSTWQLGQEGRSAGATIQPVAGPLDGAIGFELATRARDGSPSPPTAQAAGVDFVVRALARREVAVGIGRSPIGRDSASLSIRFRNVP